MKRLILSLLVLGLMLGLVGEASAVVSTPGAEYPEYAEIECFYRDYVPGVRDDVYRMPYTVIVSVNPPGLGTYYKLDVRSFCPMTYMGFPNTGARMSPYPPRSP